MSSNLNDGDSQANEPGYGPQGPGSDYMKPQWIILVGAYLVLLSGFVLYGLIKLWPYPTPSTEAPTDQVATTSAPANPSNSASPVAANSPTLAANAGGSTNRPAATSSQTPPRNSSGNSPTPPSGSGASSSPASNPAGPAAGQSPQTQPSPVSSTVAGNQKPIKWLDPEHIKFFGGRFEADVYLETRLLLLVMLSGALGSLMHALRSFYWYTGNRMMVWSWVGLYILLPITGSILATIFYFVVRGGFFSSQASFETTSPFGFIALSALVGLFSWPAILKLQNIAETIFVKPNAGENSKPQGSTAPAPASSKAAAGATANTTANTSAGEAAADELDGHDEIKSNTTDEELPITEGGVE